MRLCALALAVLVLLASLALVSCDIGGQQTNNSYQHVSNSIP